MVVGQGPELASIANALAQQIEVLPEVESVRFNLEWFQKAQAIVQLVLRINLAASVLLGMGVVLVLCTRHLVRTDRITAFSLIAVLLTAARDLERQRSTRQHLINH